MKLAWASGYPQRSSWKTATALVTTLNPRSSAYYIIRKRQWEKAYPDKFVVWNGKQRAFHVGSNLSCRQHIQSHFEIYKAGCMAKGLKVHHHAMPWNLLKKNLKKGQKTLVQASQKVSKLKEFLREGVLKAVAEFVICDDQVGAHAWCGVRLIQKWPLKSLAVANKMSFRNCLVLMHPNAVNDDARCHDIHTHWVHQLHATVETQDKGRFMPFLLIIISTLILEWFGRPSFDNFRSLVSRSDSDLVYGDNSTLDWN